MKLFLYKILLFFLFVFIIIGFIFLVPRKYRLNNPEYKRDLNTHNKIDSIHSNRVNIIIGDSRSEINFKNNNRFLNLSLSGSTPLEGYLTVKEILSNKNKIDSIIISYGPFHIHTQEIFYEKTIFYNLFNNKEIDMVKKNIDSINEINYDETVLLNNFNFDKFIKDLTFSISNIPKSIIKELIGYEHNRLLSTDLKECDCQTPEYIFSKKGLIESKVNNLYILKLKQLLDQNNIKYFYFHMPLPIDSKKPSQDYFDYYHNLTNKLNPINTFNFTDCDNFMDCSHLKPNSIDLDEYLEIN